MNAMKNLICLLGAGAVLAAATPAFADPWRDHGRDYGREHHYYQRYNYEHRGYREEDDDDEEGYNAYYPGYMAATPPVVVEPPAYYAVPEPAPAPGYYAGPATFIGAMIGSIIDSQQ
ncbi:MAG: hypothetical protein ACYC7B_07160 [Burkholderiales bacterium]